MRKEFLIMALDDLIQDKESFINDEKDKDDIFVQDKEILLEIKRQLIEQEKMIDFMINWIRHKSIYYVDSHEKLKDYFREKVKREENNL